MCDRREGLDALCAAASGLTQACLERLPFDAAMVMSADTLVLLPAAPSYFDDLLRAIDVADARRTAMRGE